VQDLQPAARRSLLERELEVLRKRLQRLQGDDARHGRLRAWTEEPRGLCDQDAPEIDDRTAAGADRQDRRLEDHAVGEEPVDGELRLGIAARADLEIRLDEGEAVIERPPVDGEVAALKPGVLLTARDRQRHEVSLLREVLGQLGEHVPVLPPQPDAVERGGRRGVRCDALVIAQDVRERRVFRGGESDRRARGRSLRVIRADDGSREEGDRRDDDASNDAHGELLVNSGRSDAGSIERQRRGSPNGNAARRGPVARGASSAA
jgi:hypothetical protein